MLEKAINRGTGSEGLARKALLSDREQLQGQLEKARQRQAAAAGPVQARACEVEAEELRGRLKDLGRIITNFDRKAAARGRQS